MNRLIVPRDIATRKAALTETEEDNFPNGRSTMHSFVTDKKLRNNEEMCVRDENGDFVLSEKDILGKWPTAAKFRAMNAKCCRLAFLAPKSRIANIFRVHGEGISTFQGAQSGDPDLGIPNDPPFGFDMQNPAEGYPCVNLLPDGRCSYYETGVPRECGRYPIVPDHLSSAFGIEITTCSVTFDENGNKITACDGCGAF